MRIYCTILALFALASVWTSAGCSGDKNSPSTLEEGFLNYTRHESVSFGISGSAACPICTERELAVLGIQVEVVPKDDPMHSMGLWPFGGIGPFTIPRLNGEAGAQIEIIGTLFLEGSAGTITAYAESAIPDENGDIVGVTLNFPSQSPSD